ncbi:sensor histidine kinase [Ruicaihuangia caeni]|uniref:sensor histidine kinase n=1 Tax=Ruicaihuangia caeni TaxID=3042517 RepID=UPI00338D4BE0
MHARLTRWWSGISLRTKVTGVTVLLVTFGLLVAGTGTISVLRAYLVDEVDKKLTSSSTQFQTRVTFELSASGALRCETTSGITESYYTAIVTPDGKLLCDNRDAAAQTPDVSGLTLGGVTAASGAPFTLGSTDGSGQWRVVSTIVPAQLTADYVIFVVGMNLRETNGIISQFGAIFFFFGINVVVLAAALTRLLVTTTFAPLRQVEATAARFADGDFDQRISGATPPNTEVGRLNRSLNAMLSRIDSAFKDRARTIEQMRRFIGDASHELRTPLVSVRGYAELYRMGALRSPEDVAQAMERIEKEAVRMGELVEDLLALARLDEAKPLQLAPVDLVPIANDAALDTAAYAPDRAVTVVVEPPAPRQPAAAGQPGVPAPAPATGAIGRAGATLAKLRRRPRPAPPAAVGAVIATPDPGDVPAVVWAEENKIRQVVTNLIGNAIRFTPEGSPIEIAVRVDEQRGMAMLAVVDHGEGIPPQIREKIFQRFWRADTSRARETGGTGLGLAIVAAIVKNHGGTVDVVDTPGGGATIQVWLPLASAHQRTDAAAPGSASGGQRAQAVEAPLNNDAPPPSVSSPE